MIVGNVGAIARGLRFSPLYRPMVRDTLARIIDNRVAHGYPRTHAARLMDELERSLRSEKRLSPSAEAELERLIENELGGGRSTAARMWQSVERASRVFKNLKETRRRGEGRKTIYGKIRHALFSLKRRPTNFRDVERSLHRAIPLLPTGPQSFDIAARIIIDMQPARCGGAHPHHYLSLLESIRGNLWTDTPELFALMSMQALGGLIEDEYPGFSVLKNGRIFEHGARIAYYQGEAYKIIASRANPASRKIYDEAVWLAENSVDYERSVSGTLAYLRYAALDSFIFLMPALVVYHDNAQEVIKGVVKDLNAFQEHGRYLDPTDRAVAAEALKEIDELRSKTLSSEIAERIFSARFTQT